MSRILVVDDDPDIRLLLRFELAAQGHDLVEAADGEEALAALDGEALDLVLLDLMMPVHDGWTVLRSLDVRSAPPVVVITAAAVQDAAHVAELLRAGALDVMPKPFDPERLLRLVAAVASVDGDERDEYRRRRLSAVEGS